MKIFKLPDLGEGLQEAEIVRWHVKTGDTVEQDAPLLSVETAKAIVDIPSPYAGRILRLFSAEHDVAHVGAPLVGFEGGDDDSGSVVGKVEVGQAVVVLEAMKMENQINAEKAGTVKEVKVKAGDTVGAGDVVVVIE